jgi:TPP-dependent pyruvate/acetoin dehydrogenase alpha subunit
MVGVAFASKVNKTDAVAVAAVSERAVATGDFHEGLNFAAVHQLPLVVVVERGSTTSAAPPLVEQPHVYERARGYRVPGLPVDGADVLQVIQVMETAVDRARAGKGPTLVEATTVLEQNEPRPEESIPVPLETNPPAPTDGGRVFSDPVTQYETFLLERNLLEPVEKGLILERIRQLSDDWATEEQAAEPGVRNEAIDPGANDSPV